MTTNCYLTFGAVGLHDWLVVISNPPIPYNKASIPICRQDPPQDPPPHRHGCCAWLQHDGRRHHLPPPDSARGNAQHEPRACHCCCIGKGRAICRLNLHLIVHAISCHSMPSHSALEAPQNLRTLIAVSTAVQLLCSHWMALDVFEGAFV